MQKAYNLIQMRRLAPMQYRNSCATQ